MVRFTNDSRIEPSTGSVSG